MPIVEDSIGLAGSKGIPLRRLVVDWGPMPPPEDIIWKPMDSASGSDADEVSPQPAFEWVSELQRRIGIVVHRMLQQMQAPDLLAFNEETVRAALQSEGLDGAKLDEAVFRAVSALQNAARDDRSRWILSGHEDDQREYALSTVVDGRVRRFVLDRTFIESGIRWIIDYKTGTHEGGGVEAFLDNEQTRYRDQLESYARAMRHIDRHPIRLGLYFPSLRGWREWKFDDAGFVRAPS